MLSSIVASTVSSTYESNVLAEAELQQLEHLKQESEELKATLANAKQLNLNRSNCASLRRRLRNIEKSIDDIETSQQQQQQQQPDEPLFGESLYTSDVDLPSDMEIDEPDLTTSAELVSLGPFVADKVRWQKLFPFQRDGVRWLLSGFDSGICGILADEMGLGKTIQTLAYLDILSLSKKFYSAIILVPATVLAHWKREGEQWCPGMVFEILHGGSNGGSVVDSIDSLYNRFFDPTVRFDFNNRKGGMRNVTVITTYETFRIYSIDLRKLNFQIIICDEGHRLKGIDTDITLQVKSFDSPLRMVLTGTPIMNSLKELWSLVDLTVPGRLGTLDVFQNEFEVPIVQGGYSNASKLMVRTAVKCASALKELIKPILLRRLKDKVLQLPNKKEHVLFCKMTPVQVLEYNRYIQSPEVQRCLSNRRISILPAIHILREYCNHPNLGRSSLKLDPVVDKHAWDAESYMLSGKMQVIAELLQVFKSEKRKVLLFTQTRTFASFLAEFLEGNGYTFVQMDGTTPVSKRVPLVDEFNTNDSIMCMLLTTRVGGLGLNITSADRVVICAPDWNPKQDQQAKERSWRVGQTKEVEIYRLVTHNTIEEKILHRQIFKTYLISRVLSNPSQRQFLAKKDISDLFAPVRLTDGEQEVATAKYFPEAKVKEEQASYQEQDSFDLDTHVDRSDPVSSSISRPNVSSDVTSFLALSGSIASAVDSDVVEHAYNDDITYLDAKAEALANEAIKELRESGRLRARAGFNVPTYTGTDSSIATAGRSDRRAANFQMAAKKFKMNVDNQSKVSSFLINLNDNRKRNTSQRSDVVLTSIKSGIPYSPCPSAKKSNVGDAEEGIPSSDRTWLVDDLIGFLSSQPEGVISKAVVDRYSDTQFASGSGALYLKKVFSIVCEKHNDRWFLKRSVLH
ncbi:hypothetical protein P9112_000617 [Eukaryota sp. TZLM1-RC]